MPEKTLTPLNLEDDITRRLADLLADQFKQPATYFCLEHEFEGELYLDSLDMVEFVMEVEEEFDIHIADDEWEAFNSVADWLNYVNRRYNR